MIKLLKTLRQILARTRRGLTSVVCMACLVPISSGCQQIWRRNTTSPAPLIPTAPSPYSTPRGGAYSPSDPMPSLYPVPPLPEPGHSIPLDPSPADSPEPVDTPPLPPSPDGVTSSKKSFFNLPKLWKPTTAKSSKKDAADAMPPAELSLNSKPALPAAIPELPKMELPKMESAANPVISKSRELEVRRVTQKSVPISSSAPAPLPSRVPDNDDSLPIITPGAQYTRDSKDPIEMWPGSRNATKTGGVVRLKKQRTQSIADIIPEEKASENLPELQAPGSSSAPVLLPPGN